MADVGGLRHVRAAACERRGGQAAQLSWDEALESALARGCSYTYACAAAIALGWIAYLPMWQTHFFADDVDFFGGLCAALQDGRLSDWLWFPGNGHLSVLPKLGYYAIWRWGHREVFLWHLCNAVLWSSALVALSYLYRDICRTRWIAICLVLLFACSGAYSSLLLTPPAANHLWSACAATWSLWAAWRYLSGGYTRHLVFGLSLGFASYLSVASGVLAFVFQAALGVIVAERAPVRRRVTLAAACVVLGLAAVGIQMHLGGAKDRPDLLFGCRETLRALYALDKRFVAGQALSQLIWLVVLVHLTVNYRRVRVRLVLFSLTLILFPLMLATSFRSAFPGIGLATRYCFLPLAGATLLFGHALALPSPLRAPRWLTGRLAAIGGAGVIVYLVMYSALANCLVLAPNTMRLYELEREIGQATVAYSKATGSTVVEIPNYTIGLPTSPDIRPLDYIARYAVPAGAGIRVVGVHANSEFETFVWSRFPPLAATLRLQMRDRVHSVSDP